MRNFFDLLGSNARIVVALALCGLGTSNAVAQGERSDYIPFVEEGKAWYCGYYHPYEVFPPTPEDPNGLGVDCIFTMCGDTLISDRGYKKVYCRYGEYYGDEEQHYYCAVREEAYQVFIIEAETMEEKLLYDFSNPGEFFTFTYGGEEVVRTKSSTRHSFLPGQCEYRVCPFLGDDVDYNHIWGSYWIEGAGSASDNPFATELYFFNVDKLKFGKTISVRSCIKDGKRVFDTEWMVVPNVPNEKCATPTIAYDNGKLVFGCETPDVEYVYEIKCLDNVSGRSSEVSLSQTYEIRVHATLDGYEDSDVAVATIGWRGGRPVMEGFSSVILDEDGNCDVNGDGTIDVADIARIIDSMAR